jgi:hypothetical protein
MITQDLFPSFALYSLFTYRAITLEVTGPHSYFPVPYSHQMPPPSDGIGVVHAYTLTAFTLVLVGYMSLYLRLPPLELCISLLESKQYQFTNAP